MYGHGVYEISTSLGLLLSLVVLLMQQDSYSRVPSIKAINAHGWMLPGKFAVLMVLLYLLFVTLYLYEGTFRAFWLPAIGVFPALFTISAFYSLWLKRYLVFFVLCIAIIISIGFYYQYGFSGFGRINVVAMLLASIIVVSREIPSWIYKIGIVGAGPFAIGWAGIHRMTKGETEFSWEATVDTFETGAGIGSILAPFQELVSIVSQSTVWGMRPAVEWFDQLIFTLLFWFPRVWWPEKPEGFARVLVYELRPELSHTGYLMAASIFGEFAYYTGVFAPFFATIMILMFVRAISFLECLRSDNKSSVSLIYLALVSYMLAQAITLIWGGVASYATRGFAAFCGFFAIFILWSFLRSVSAAGHHKT